MVVLIPPAVEAGLPPINIKKQVNTVLAVVKFPISKVENPAVRVVVLKKSTLTIFSPKNGQKTSYILKKGI